MRTHSLSRLFMVSAALSLLATGAQSQGVAAAGSDTVPVPNTASSPTRAGAESPTPGGASQFILGVADVIRVSIWKNADLSQTVTVGPDGFVSLPLLGDVHVAGMTANQMAQVLATRLASYVVSPQVTVSVVDIRSRQVYVLGQVGKPGGYPLVAPITVLQLIAQAGGLSPFANRKGILILRANNGNTQKLRFNYSNAINGDDKQNISLQPGDTVIVR